jgi:hypothetical protein
MSTMTKHEDGMGGSITILERGSATAPARRAAAARPRVPARTATCDAPVSYAHSLHWPGGSTAIDVTSELAKNHSSMPVA